MKDYKKIQRVLLAYLDSYDDLDVLQKELINALILTVAKRIQDEISEKVKT